MSNSRLIVGTMLALTAACIGVFLSFGNSALVFQVLTALALASLLACPLIHARRERRRFEQLPADTAAEWQESSYSGPSDTTVAVTLAIGLGMLALLLVSASRWPAAVAFSLIYVLMNLLVSARKPFRNMLIAIAATFCLWPIDSEIVSRFETRTSTYLARLVSDRLDNQSVLNLPLGRTVKTLGGTVEVGSVDGEMHGLRLGALLGTVLAVYLRRNALHVLLMAASGWFWAVVLNGFYAYGTSVRQNSGGTLESLWGYPVVTGILGCILLLSTDQLWLVLGIFNPFTWISRDRKRSPKPSSAGENVDESQADDDFEDEEAPARTIPAAVFYGLGAAALVVAILDIGQNVQSRSRNARLTEVWRAASTKNDPTQFPERLGRWARSQATPLIDSKIPSRGAHQVTAVYTLNDRFARVSFLGPYRTWRNRFLDYVGKGWRTGLQRIINDTERNISVVLNEFSLPTGEHLYVVYGMSPLDGSKDRAIPASIRGIRQSVLWEFFQSLFFRRTWTKDYYMTEVVLETYAPLTPTDSQALDELIRETQSLSLPQSLRFAD